MGSCSSACFTIQYGEPGVVTVSPNSYSNCDIPTPPIPEIVFGELTGSGALRSRDVTLRVSSTTGYARVRLLINIFGFVDSVIPESGIDAGLITSNNRGIFYIQLINPPTMTQGAFKLGDLYEINTCVAFNQNYIAVTRSSTIRLVATGTQMLSSNIVTQDDTTTANTCTSCISSRLPMGCTNPVCQSECGNVRVPIILITGQTTIDGSDMGDVRFQIFDEFQYYGKCGIDNKCQVIFINPDLIKETRFDICCPFIVSVLKGKGNTAREKATYLYNRSIVKMEANMVTFVQFSENLLLYAMAKYILSRILYGNFDINYLLGKYNDKFIEDLGESRFCSFVAFFIDCNSASFGYNKYFKFSKR